MRGRMENAPTGAHRDAATKTGPLQRRSMTAEVETITAVIDSRYSPSKNDFAKNLGAHRDAATKTSP